jgi:ribosomal protein S18 acetylase RimI-like enzyme
MVPHHDLDITTDPNRIPVDEALALLRATYWASSMARETLERAMRNSLCFGALDGSTLVAFARVVTDRATYAYLTDVVVAPDRRGRGVGQRVMEYILEHPDLQGLRRFALLTTDAAGLYEKFGFVVGTGEHIYMERR